MYRLLTFCFFSPSWPLSSCTASVTMFTLITSKTFYSLLSSLLCFFSLFLSSTVVFKTPISLLSFSLFSVLELTPASPCVLLYMFSPLTTPLSRSPPSNPDSSALFLFQRALLRVRGVGMCLICKGNTCFVRAEEYFSQATGVLRWGVHIVPCLAWIMQEES